MKSFHFNSFLKAHHNITMHLLCKLSWKYTFILWYLHRYIYALLHSNLFHPIVYLHFCVNDLQSRECVWFTQLVLRSVRIRRRRFHLVDWRLCRSWDRLHPPDRLRSAVCAAGWVCDTPRMLDPPSVRSSWPGSTHRDKIQKCSRSQSFNVSTMEVLESEHRAEVCV